MDVDSNDIVVPPTNCPLSPSEMAELRSLCNPLSTTDDLVVTITQYGSTVYIGIAMGCPAL